MTTESPTAPANFVDAPPPRRSWRDFHLRPAVVAVGIALVCAALRSSAIDPIAPSAEAAVAEALGSRGLTCDATDVVWVDGPHSVRSALAGGARALVRAGTPGEPRDLYLIEARLSPERVVLAVVGVWNVTETSGVDESRPMLRGRLALYTTAAEGLVTGVHLLDLSGGPDLANAGLSRFQRIQVGLTSLQQTGQASGVMHTAFMFDPIARQASVVWRTEGTIEARADGHLVVIDPAGTRVLTGDPFIRVVLDERARPGNLATWAVDRLRAMAWVGDDRMQWVKAVGFTLLDKVHALLSTRTTVEDVRSELGISAEATPAHATFVDPDTGWPPPPMATITAPRLPGEGQWIALDDDPFITPAAGGGGPGFVTSFVRPDRARQDERVYVTLWDPRRIELHIEAGTVEPISATGEHGPGLVPRTPEVIGRFVAAFNGGFQAQHGEYGMQANGIEYIPPKPYAATVLELRDGSNAFGAWPDSAAIPDDVVGFRQNLTALVQDGKFNPWGRTWWGGTPPGWPDQIHSTRSAICLTKEGFIGYFYSTSISADDLAEGMLAARCSFGIHLDMNPGHAGFEFYDVAREGSLRPLPRRLQSDWEAEGKVPDLPGYVFRSRRMIRGMGHMLFPRYIHREARDFFYLVMRPALPGAPLVSAAPDPAPGEGVWRVKGLPQHGFPYALATTWVRLDPRRPELRAWVLQADARALRPADPASGDAPTVLGLAASGRGSLTLWWSRGAFMIAPNAPAQGASALIGGHLLDDPRALTARTAVGIQDEDGTLVWLELPASVRADASTARAMDEFFARVGCSIRIGVPGDAHAFPGGALDVRGDPLAQPPPPGAVRLVRAPSPDARAMFVETPVVPVQVWQPLQAKRVRYLYKPAPNASDAGANAQPSSTATLTPR